MQELKGLKDIKDIVPIDTFNPLWILLVLFLALALALYFKFFKKESKKFRFKLTLKEKAKNRINSINWSDAKLVTYIFTQDVALFVDESNTAEYSKILKELECFKYKKEIPEMSKELKEKLEQFIKGIKW
jgi:cytochrome c-type biogenesis protein CcmH/NrfF